MAHGATVYLEDSAAAQELADEAVQLMAEGRAGEAAQRLHRMVEAYPEKLMPWGEGRYTDARLWVRERLGADPALRRAYRSRFGDEADRALRDAVSAAGEEAELDVRRVWETYGWTRAGLDAALWLAGGHLERADADGAMSTLVSLEQHPDLPERVADYYELRAWSAALAGNDSETAAMIEALRVAGEGPRADALEQTLNALLLSDRQSAATSAEPTPPPPLSRTLWEVEIVDASESAQTASLRRRNPQLAQSLNQNLLPVASESALLFNDSLRVFALDRTSGRLRWVYRPASAANDDPNDAQAALRARQIALGRSLPDPRQVLIRGDSAYGVVGNITALRGQRRGQTLPPTRLVCLDVENGEPRWVVTPQMLDPTLARAAFHGTPVAYGGQIIVMARRSQASSFQDSYLMSVDAATGQLRWRRHLASTSAGNQRNAITALSSMSLEGQRLYFCDNLGAAASLDAMTGTVHWVRVLDATPADMVDRRRQTRRVVVPTAGAIRPTLSPAGLILSLRISEDRGLLLEPETGRVLQRFGDEHPLAQARQIFTLPNGDLLTTGGTFRRLDGQSLSTRWAQPAPDGQTPDTVSVSLLRDRGVAMIGTTPRRFDELNMESGEYQRRHTVPWTGHVLALDHAWIVCSGQRVGSYLDWPIAYRELKQRSESNPSSVVPGLSMATLALNAGRTDAMDEGIQRALAALARMSATPDGDQTAGARGRVFRELLALTEKPTAVDPGLIESLFDRLASITETPGELVAYNLARGEFLENRGRLTEATDFYQAVLLDPTLSDELWSRNQSTRRADLVARQRLLDMLNTHGRAFYEDFDARARQQLVALRLDPATSAEDLRDLVRRYPLARVAAEATLAAAEIQARSTAHAGAAVQYRRAFQLAEDNAIRSRAAGALASYYQAQGRLDTARAWLESLNRRYPDLEPYRNGAPYPTTAWIEELGNPQAASLARRGVRMPLGEAVRLEGTLVRYHSPHRVPSADDLVLLRSPAGRLLLYDVTRKVARWEVPEPAQNLALIHLGEDNLILWSRSDRLLHGMDTSTGQPLWPPIAVMPLLDQLGEGGLASTRRANAGQIIELIEANFGPIPRGNNAALANRQTRAIPTIAAGDAVVGVVDAQGRAAGIDRYTGRVLWQSALPVDTVNHLAIGAEVLAVGGLAAPGTDAQAGRLILLDQFTGRPRFPVVEDDQPLTWLGFSPDRGVVAASADRLTLYDADHGATRWRVDLLPQTGARQVVMSGEAVYLSDNNSIHSIDITTGKRRAALPLTHRNVQLRSYRDGLVALVHDNALSNSCVALDADLRVVWRDVIQVPQKRFLRLELGLDHAFVVQLDRQVERGRLNLFALENQTGRLVEQRALTELKPHPVPTDLRVLPDGIVLSGRDWTVLVPGSPP